MKHQASFKRGAKFVLGLGTKVFRLKKEEELQKALEEEETEWFVNWLSNEEVFNKNQSQINKLIQEEK